MQFGIPDVTFSTIGVYLKEGLTLAMKIRSYISSSLLVLAGCISSAGFAQVEYSETRNFLWFTPSTATTINGIGIGPANSGNGRTAPLDQTINGIQIELPGIRSLKFPLEIPERRYLRSIDTQGELTVNGVLAAVSGSSGVDRINGVFVTAFCGFAREVNGVSLNPVNFVGKVDGVTFGLINNIREGGGASVGIYNNCEAFDGTQVGLINIRKHGSGPQIGLINISAGRFLPFLNF
jgi:hypothetical protein